MTVGDEGGGAGASKSIATLLRSESLLRRAERIAKTGSFIWEARTGAVEWSEGLYEMFGVDPSVSPGSELFLSLVHPDDRTRIDQLRPILLEGRAAEGVEVRILRASDGARRHLRMNTERLEDQTGQFVGIVGTMVDVTERAEAEEALRESEARWRSIAVNPFDFVVLVDSGGVFQWVNHTAPGIREEDLIGKASILDYVAPEYQPRVLAALERTFVHGLPSYYEVYSPILDAWYASAVGPLLRDGKTVLASVLTRDISEIRQAEIEFRRQDRLMRDAQRIAGFGSFYWDDATRKFEWSPEMFRIYGVATTTVPTRELQDSLIHPDDRDRVIEARERAFVVGVAEPVEFRIIRASDAAVRYVLSTGEALYGSDGAPSGFLGATLDVTARRELEADLAQSRKLEAIGRLAGGIAHDFNNVLTAIVGNVEIVARDAAPVSPTSASLEAIKSAARRASNLTRQLLAFARRQIVSPRVIEPNPVIESVAELIRPLLGERIALELALYADVWSILIDVGQFEQLLMNLAVNARDAMPNGGVLRVEATNVVFDHVQRGPAELSSGPYVCIVVADTGHGIPPELQPHVFEPFFTTKPAGRGTGLGLATCHGIAKQNGGHIRLESVEGRGTRMFVYLPRSTELPEKEDDAASSRMPSGSENVLVVEHDAEVRSLAVRHLTDLGHRVLHAATGAEALQVMETAAGPIDVLVVDAALPDHPCSDLVTRLADLYPRARVLYTSPFTEDAFSASGAPRSPFLRQPYTDEALGRAVCSLLEPPVAGTPRRGPSTRPPAARP